MFGVAEEMIKNTEGISLYLTKAIVVDRLDANLALAFCLESDLELLAFAFEAVHIVADLEEKVFAEIICDAKRSQLLGDKGFELGFFVEGKLFDLEVVIASFKGFGSFIRFITYKNYEHIFAELWSIALEGVKKTFDFLSWKGIGFIGVFWYSIANDHFFAHKESACIEGLLELCRVSILIGKFKKCISSIFLDKRGFPFGELGIEGIGIFSVKEECRTEHQHMSKLKDNALSVGILG